MSVKVMAQVWELQLAPAHLIVLLALADHADDLGRNAFPSIARLAWKTGYSESQVRRILKQLTKSGVIERVERAGRTTMYTVKTGNGVQKTPFVVSKSEGAQNDTPTIAMTPHPYHSYDTPTPTIAMTPESSVEPSSKQGKRNNSKRNTDTKNQAVSEIKERVKTHPLYQAYHETAFPPTPVTLANAVEHMDAVEALQSSGITPEQIRVYMTAQKQALKFTWLPDRVGAIAQVAVVKPAAPVDALTLARRKAAAELLKLQNAAAKKEGVA